jgi:hypothetical protein
VVTRKDTNPRIPEPMVNSFAHAINFGTPAGIGWAQYRLDRSGQSLTPVNARVIATEESPEEVVLELQTRVDLMPSLSQLPSEAWVHAATVRVRYGSSGTVDLFGTYINPPGRVQIVLRPQLLRDRADQP